MKIIVLFSGIVIITPVSPPNIIRSKDGKKRAQKTWIFLKNIKKKKYKKARNDKMSTKYPSEDYHGVNTVNFQCHLILVSWHLSARFWASAYDC